MPASCLSQIQNRRKEIWKAYDTNFISLKDKGVLRSNLPEYATNNAHMYYLVCRSLAERTELIAYLKELNIISVFHYLSLHKSPYYKNKHDGRVLMNSDKFEDCLVRLPFYYELTSEDQNRVINAVNSFYKQLD